MSCSCENRAYSQELTRIRRLAKALAILENCDVVIYVNENGSLGFAVHGENDKPIKEYITPYE